MRRLLLSLALLSVCLSVVRVCAQRQQTTDTASRAGGRDRRDKKSFRSWQERARSEAASTGLSLPVLSAPVIREIRRSEVELEWWSNYRPPADDTTPAGYEITVQEDQQKEEREHEEAQTATAPVATRFLLQDLAETPDVARTAQASQPVYKYRARVQGLKPGTRYTFRWKSACQHLGIC